MYISAHTSAPLPCSCACARVSVVQRGSRCICACRRPRVLHPLAHPTEASKPPVAVPRAPGRFGGCKSTCQFFWTKASLGSLSPATGDIPRLLRGALGSFWGSTFRELIAGGARGRENWSASRSPFSVGRHPAALWRLSYSPKLSAESGFARKNTLGEEHAALLRYVALAP